MRRERASILLEIDHAGLESPRRVVCHERRISVGRSSSMDVTIDHDVVSSHHLTITCSRVAWSLRDESTTNGTVVNGHRLTAGTAEPLESGADITIEQVCIRVANLVAPRPAVQDPGPTMANDGAIDHLVQMLDDVPATPAPGTSEVANHDNSRAAPDGDAEGSTPAQKTEAASGQSTPFGGRKKTTDDDSSVVTPHRLTFWLTLGGVGLLVSAAVTVCVYLLFLAR
jgi:predicted component of type VI protein secretion system